MTNHSQLQRVSALLVGILTLVTICGGTTLAQSNSDELSENTARLLLSVDEEMVKNLEEAWISTGAGALSFEAAILVYRSVDGSYKGELQNQTREYVNLAFKWSPSAIAIIHTHPTRFDPLPSSRDKLLAERLHVPVFTITTTGMYAYDPVTRKTCKVQNNLDWLDIAKWKASSSRIAGK